MDIKKNSTKQIVEMALLVAIIVLLAFTPIGYIKTFGLEITLIVVPVTVGAVTLGPAAGAALGTVFGITSFIQCFGMSPFGAGLLEINPFLTCIVCIVPRLLMGWLTGLAYQGLCKVKFLSRFSVVIANLIGPLLNTLLFTGLLVLFFYQTPPIQNLVELFGSANIMAFMIAFVGINGAVEAAVCFIVGSAVSRALQSAWKRSQG